jgi:hypothetical protein
MLFVFAGLEAFAQDMIIYKDKTIDEVTIVEVTPDYVKVPRVRCPYQLSHILHRKRLPLKTDF